MGTTAGRSARLPWDVPVEVVARPAARAQRGLEQGERLVLRVAAVRPGPAEGAVLAPDLRLLVATAQLDGREVLAGIVRDVAELTDAWPAATLALIDPIDPDAAGTAAATTASLPTLADVLARLGTPLPVLVSGTMLTIAVHRALAEVPIGATVSYAQLAARAGAPRAVRAAARVMSTNVVPLVLPCHRVVPSGGGTGRYGWGADVKVRLLALERALADAA
jgi:O-6-methylguanine DNA methyltransferase